MFWGVQGDSLEHARAIAYAWDVGRLEYPEGSCKVISAGTKYWPRYGENARYSGLEIGWSFLYSRKTRISTRLEGGIIYNLHKLW